MRPLPHNTPWVSRYEFTRTQKRLTVQDSNGRVVAYVPLYGETRKAEAIADTLASMPDLLDLTEKMA